MPLLSGRSSRVPGVIGSMRLPDFYGRNIESRTRQNKGGTADFALCILGVQRVFCIHGKLNPMKQKSSTGFLHNFNI